MAKSTPSPPRELVIFDVRVPNLEYFLMGLRLGVEAIVLVGDLDGVHQITSWLKNHHRFGAVHIFARGKSHGIQLGNIVLTLENLPQYQRALGECRQHLTRDSVVQIYTNKLSSSPHCGSFIEQLGQQLNATIALSRYQSGQGCGPPDFVYGGATISSPLNPKCIDGDDLIL